jgi:hypothetical protein
MQDCPPLRPYIDEAARDACQLDPSIKIPGEDVGLFHRNSIPILLGNNPIWLAGQSKPANSSYVENATWGGVGSLSEGVGDRGSLPLNLNATSGVLLDNVDVSEWELKGCIADSTNNRALEGVAITNQPEMNLRKCAILCEVHGYSIAGVEFGTECYCDNALRNGVHLNLISNVTCGTPCPGNRTYSSFLSVFLLMICRVAYENCGGSNALTLLALEGVDIRTTGESRAYPVYHISLVTFVTTLFTSFLLFHS